MSMDDAAIGAEAVAGRRARLAPARWKLWSETPLYLAYWSGTVGAAVIFTAISAIGTRPHVSDLIMLGVLIGLGVLQAEGSRKVERWRRIFDDKAPHINLTSAWTFAGVLILPPVFTAVLVAVLYGHLARRAWRQLRATPTYRTVSNACRTILTCYIGYQVLTMTGLGDIHGVLNLGWASTKGLAWTIAIYFGFAAVAAIPGLKPSTKSLTELLGGWVDNLLEAVTLLTAVVLAVILVSPLPFLAITIVPLLVFVHRGVLYKHVEYLASTDDKTGLFNTEGWHFRAAETLTRAKRDHTHGAVLMADLDHFKKVNDLYGHLAGDAVLKAVAGVLRDNLRGYDTAARFGGEEFVILLADITTDDALRVAERIRQAIAKLEVQAVTTKSNNRIQTIRGLSVSIGVATFPEAGFGAELLIMAADTALEIAKGMGRNQVKLATASSN